MQLSFLVSRRQTAVRLLPPNRSMVQLHQLEPDLAAEQRGGALERAESHIAVFGVEQSADLAAARTHALGEALARKPLRLHCLGNLPGKNFLDRNRLKGLPSAFLSQERIQAGEILRAA